MKVREIWRYPIKSIGGERLLSATIDRLGVDGDRRWGLVDETSGLVLTARREPRLLHARCSLVDGRPVTVTESGLELATSEDYCRWLDRPVRLVAAGNVGGVYENPMNAEQETDWVSWQGPAEAWHDSGRARVSLISTASLGFHRSGPWPFVRFRSNILLDGGGEDALTGSQIGLGDAHLTITKAIGRCVMVTRTQPGLARDLSVLQAINAERNGTLAVGATVDRPGHIAEGDELLVIAGNGAAGLV